MSKSTRQTLEFMADRVEAVMIAHRTPGRVTGGTVGPQIIRFFVQPAPHIRFAQVERLREDLALGLRTRELKIDRGAEGIILEFDNPEPIPVGFAHCLQVTDETLPATSAMLGMKPDGSTLLMQLASPDVGHVLISGTTGSGKTVLERVIAASLVLKNAPDVVRLLVIDPKNRLIPPAFDLPHLLRVVTQINEFAPTLHDLVHTMEHRDAQRQTMPHIAVIIDELSDIVMNVEGAVDLITRLVQRGREAGIHVIAATQHPSSAILGPLMRANFPLRLVGRVVSADDARIASGQAGTGAERLRGRGDFLAVHASSVERFQTPLVEASALGRIVSMVPATAIESVLLEAPAQLSQTEPDDQDAIRLREDMAVLMERAQREGRMPVSKREAERWRFGSNRGGVFFDRASEALAAMWHEGVDLTQPQSNGMITAIVSKITALAG